MIEPEELEWRTRRERIDPRLKAAGWDVARADERTGVPTIPTAVTELPTENGPADYAWALGGRLVAVAEAKKVRADTQEVLKQAERYARGLSGTEFSFDGYAAPFLYSTNGEVIWFRDVRHPMNAQRKIAHFHTPAAIEELLSRDLDEELRKLAALPVGTDALRPYQWEAVENIERAIADRKRKMLVAMATGTGKTRLMVSQVYRLLKAGVAKRPPTTASPGPPAADKQLRDLAKQNTPTRAIGIKTGRTPGAVQCPASDVGVSLKPTNQSPYNRRKS